MGQVATINSNQELFKFWIEQGWKQRLSYNEHMKANVAQYKSRLKYEVSMIQEKEFAHIVPEILQGRKPPRPGVAVRELKIKARNVIRKRFVDGELEP